jgi:hypothetical protein
MELAVATKVARTRSALIVASSQLLLLIVLSYGISYIVPACISFASLRANEDRGSSTLVHTSGFEFTAELACESAPPRLWEHSACDLPK